MRFIGNKESLLDSLYHVVVSTNINQGTFCDFFAGTASVGRFFKQKGFRIISSDLLYFSYVLQMAYIKNNEEPKFNKLLKVIDTRPSNLFSTPLDLVISYLNDLKGSQGFIYKNYTTEGTKGKSYQRKFFIPENGKRIDTIRITIEDWKNKQFINTNEYYILLTCLIETVPFYANISGVYAAYLKTYDPRAIKPIKLRSINIYKNNKNNLVYNKNSMDILNKFKAEILYIDPPYNARQYGANYHLLETIAKYDNPVIKGVAGLRDYTHQKSDFCNKDAGLKALDIIAKKSRYKFLMLSYSSEGIMPKTDIFKVLSKYGELKLIELDYRRFKSNNNGDSKHKKFIQEQVYLLRRK